ncbi:MAG: IclR family transcriptional regulator [Alphaproteobacteria bacterium]|nr:IclR family transcriptional regulator [Alphaproteobacteria bacterium]
MAAGLRILEAVALAKKPPKLTEIATLIDRPKSSTHRLLAALCTAGFLKREEKTRAYMLTTKMWSLGVSVFAEYDLPKIARPHLEDFMVKTNEASHLAVLEGVRNVVFIDRVRSGQLIAVNSFAGDRFPAFSSASGRAILAFQGDAIVDAALAPPLTSSTPRTVTEPSSLKTILESVRRDGVAVVKGETYEERAGVAAPIRDHTGHVIAACGVAVPVFRLNDALIEILIATAKEAARRISHDLGYDGACAPRKP